MLIVFSRSLVFRLFVPADGCAIVAFVEGVPLEMLDNTFIEMIKASVDKPLPITVYNYKSMTTRCDKLRKRWRFPLTPGTSAGCRGCRGRT